MGSAFTAGDYKWPPNSEERKALIAKINKQISHLTDQRTLTAQEKIGERDRTALYVLLVADFKNFTQYQELAASNGSLKQSPGASAPGLLFMRGNRAKEKSRPGAWSGQWGRLGIFSEHPKSTSMVKTQ